MLTGLPYGGQNYKFVIADSTNPAVYNWEDYSGDRHIDHVYETQTINAGVITFTPLAETRYTWSDYNPYQDSAVIFAWVFGGDLENDEWRPTTKLSTYSLSVDMTDAGGCCFVRFRSDVTEPSWSLDGDHKWNQSSNANEYNIVTWPIS